MRALILLLSLVIFHSAEAEMIDNKGKLNPVTCQLLEVVARNVGKMTFDAARGEPPAQAEVDKLFTCGLNACELRDFLQKYFLRPKGEERLSPKTFKFYDGLFGGWSQADKDKVLGDFKALNYIDPIYPDPSHKSFTFIVIHGSLIDNMRDRIMMLDRAVRDGKVALTANTKIIFANGYRPIWPQEVDKVTNTAPYAMNPDWKPDWLADDGTVITAKEPKDERALARVAWDQLNLSPSLRAKAPVFLDAPKKAGQARAQTEDTMDSWLARPDLQPHVGDTCLSISTQPFAAYQAEHVDAFLKPQHIQCELLADEAPVKKFPINVALGTLFDNAARELYEKVPRVAGTCANSVASADSSSEL